MCSLRHCFCPQIGSVQTAVESLALESLTTEEVGYLLDSGELSEYRETFAAAKISGRRLQLLQKNSDLEQLGIKMPDLIFYDLFDQVSKVGYCLFLLFFTFSCSRPY